MTFEMVETICVSLIICIGMVSFSWVIVSMVKK